MARRISHTSFDARDAYAQPVFWSQVLDFVDDPDDPNEPGHAECLITSRDRSQLLLFITVPEVRRCGVTTDRDRDRLGLGDL